MCHFSNKEVDAEIARIMTMDGVSPKVQLRFLVDFRTGHLGILSGAQYQKLIAVEESFQDSLEESAVA